MTKTDVWAIISGIPTSLAFAALWVATLLGIGPMAEPWWGPYAILVLWLLQTLMLLNPVHRLMNRKIRVHFTFKVKEK